MITELSVFVCVNHLALPGEKNNNTAITITYICASASVNCQKYNQKKNLVILTFS